MPRRSRHRLSLLRLARGAALSWLARALAMLLVLGNAFAAVAPLRMLAMNTHATHDVGTMVATAAAAADDVAMTHHHHHAAGALTDGHAMPPAPHAAGCPCCDAGHCHCLQACSPLPQIAAGQTATPLLLAVVPAPMRVATAISILDTPPLRPPIA